MTKPALSPKKLSQFILSIPVATHEALLELLCSPPPVGYRVHHTMAYPTPLKKTIRVLDGHVLPAGAQAQTYHHEVVVYDILVGYHVVYELMFTPTELGSVEMEFEVRSA